MALAEMSQNWSNRLGNHVAAHCEQCDQIWRNFATLEKSFKNFDNFCRVNFVFGIILNLLAPIIMLLGKLSLL